MNIPTYIRRFGLFFICWIPMTLVYLIIDTGDMTTSAIVALAMAWSLDGGDNDKGNRR